MVKARLWQEETDPSPVSETMEKSPAWLPVILMEEMERFAPPRLNISRFSGAVCPWLTSFWPKFTEFGTTLISCDPDPEQIYSKAPIS